MERYSGQRVMNANSLLETKRFSELRDRAVLIIDDDRDMSLTIKRMVESWRPRHVETSNQPKLAITSIKHKVECPDLIISDLHMTPINGLHMLKAVRTGINPVLPRDTPVIFLTGYGREHLLNLAQKLGADAFLIKPVRQEKLAQTISMVFKQSKKAESADHYRAVSIPGEADLWAL